MTPEEIKAKYSLKAEFERHNIKLFAAGGQKWKCICPFHKDKTPSLSIDDEKGLWNCFGCQAGGSVIDFVAKIKGISTRDAIRELDTDPKPNFDRQKNFGPEKARIVKSYSYQDANGNELYQVCRLEPKSFRQRHLVNGEWVWNMEGVERVLYRQPEWKDAQQVFIVEGEKDADSLAQLGFVATCNVCGAGKWLDSYSDSLAGKDIILCGDNDDPGREHIKTVMQSICGKVASTRTITVPPPHKDISDFIASFKQQTDAANKAICEMVAAAKKFIKGIDLPVLSMYEIQQEYMDHIKHLNDVGLSLNKWLPGFWGVRPLVPGEVVTFLADTGVGKTAALQCLAIHANPMPTIMFEMELPNSLLFERFVSSSGDMTPAEIESEYKEGRQWDVGIDRYLKHIHICPRPGLTVEDITRIIQHSELKTGCRPRLVLIDYVQLVKAPGSRYEKTSLVAEEIKTMAKATQTIVIVASQVARKKDGGPEITLHEAKDSGSIENSSGLVIGLWRDSKESSTMVMKILKNTKGKSGKEIRCNFDGEKMIITEQSITQPRNFNP